MIMTIEKVLSVAKKYCSTREQAIIKDAYKFACDVHKNQTRGTGESYIDHPLNVAYFLSENELDYASIAAALLHDTEEEDPQYKKLIEEKFGKEIAELVEGVTKLGKIKIKKSWFLPIKFLQNHQQKQLGFKRHIESLRKMLLAMSKDIRVILIKFADRLHNMQTLEGVRPDKRHRIAQETLEVYAPIAHRLGMGKLKAALETLSFPYVYPKEYKETLKLTGKKYLHKEKVVNETISKVKEILNENKIKYFEIDGRKKQLYSLWKKLVEFNYQIDKIYDIVAVRIVVSSIEDCYSVLGLIHKTWRPLIGRIKDYIAVPKPNGYQSLHTTIFGPFGEIIEIQIRTIEMHQKAEFGIAAHWQYKEKNNKSFKSELYWLNELANWQENQTDKNELIRGLNLDFFNNRIFVFTPQGDIHDLPSNSTPVDFAYSIHTEVGNSCCGTKVNGKIAKLDHKLKNGDIVEIVTNPKSNGPKKDWLRFVITQRARNKIKNLTSNNLIINN
jgi:GTP pyrophosphokinase